MIGLEGALFKRWKLEGNEGSRAHLKGGRIENALPLMVEGSKAQTALATQKSSTNCCLG